MGGSTVLHFFVIDFMLVMRDDVVSQRLGFGRWYFFICVTNWRVFLTFPYPMPLAQGSRDIPKNCAILLAVTSNHVQVRMGSKSNRQKKLEENVHVHTVPTHELDNCPTPFKIVLTYTSTSRINAFRRLLVSFRE